MGSAAARIKGDVTAGEHTADLVIDCAGVLIDAQLSAVRPRQPTRFGTAVDRRLARVIRSVLRHSLNTDLVGRLIGSDLDQSHRTLCQSENKRRLGERHRTEQWLEMKPIADRFERLQTVGEAEGHQTVRRRVRDQ